MNTNTNWQPAYNAAVVETDSFVLAAKVHLAEEAIFARLRTLPIAEDQERLAMQQALTALHRLRTERLGNRA
jgi:hypothetical protein